MITLVFFGMMSDFAKIIALSRPINSTNPIRHRPALEVLIFEQKDGTSLAKLDLSCRPSVRLVTQH
jgi:hypothetical protein